MTTEEKYEAMRQIRDEVLALVASPLYEFRTSHNYLPVIGEGSHDARVMFIGEAPGRNEAETGRPFCGAAGKTLDTLLESIGIPRTEVYITNIVKDRPPENRDPLPDEIDEYGPFLDRQIALIQPRVIVTLGRYSMQYIMRKFDLEFELEPISRAHGKRYGAKASYGSIHIIPQYHPAAAIYNRELIDTLKQDFKLIPTFL